MSCPGSWLYATAVYELAQATVRADTKFASGTFGTAQTSPADPPSMGYQLKWSTDLRTISKISAILAVAALASCGVLPTIGPDMALRSSQPVQLEGARGPLSVQQSKAILAGLASRGQETSIFERNLALEESVVGAPLVVGNP